MRPFCIQIFPSSPEYRYNLFKQLHEIVFYGKGGYDFDTVYNLPIWLRRFIYSEINKHYEQEAEASKGHSSNSSNSKEPPKIPNKAFNPPRVSDISVKRSAGK